MNNSHFIFSKFKVIFYIGLLVLCFACVEDIDIDTGEEMPIVVDCVLRNSHVQTLRLYRLRHLYKNEYKDIEGAGVELFKEEIEGKTSTFVKVAEFLQKDGPDWEAQYQPEYGAKYKLRVIVNGKELAHAFTTFPEDLKLVMHMSPFDSLGVGYRAITGEVSEPRYVLWWGDWPYIESETPFKVYERSIKPCKIWIYPHTDTTIVIKPDNKYSIQQAENVRFSGSTKPYAKYVVTDHPGADNFNVVGGSMSDIDFFNVPVNSYLYNVHTLNLHPNISQWCPLVKPELPLHDRFVRIDHPKGFDNGFYGDRLEHGYQYSSGSFFIFGDYDNYMAGLLPFTLEVRFLSDEYDTFMRELYLKKSSRDDFILSTYERKNIYTNIIGGLGVFGAENTTWAEHAYWFQMWYFTNRKL